MKWVMNWVTVKESWIGKNRPQIGKRYMTDRRDAIVSVLDYKMVTHPLFLDNRDRICHRNVIG